ncbi:CRISPR system Cascade subunit CasC [Kineosphaera limosa]|uniref:Putative CRISPR-associated protein n=1 Tax=Kineosphaera limosa NBRC 100340 TaxID=1184609 RepID=K6X8V2_9MICO|nr:type I-E CRISPR-associated protein Cas7/Cse4/CasC [Kineosphaera limosa]NYE01505.1 CRISPR system Cascade subunit CasC [Kineosphaera limosa]GAB95249.1 putative CRISPR-associated protein [Kineosphaera limosa NBRC 100340]
MTNSPSLFIDVHVLQTVPPSNLNRDDTGTPKSAWYGGVQRARVSSQAWKKATRADFKAHLDAADLAHRTKWVIDQLTERLQRLDPSLADDAAYARAQAVLKAVGFQKFEKPRTGERKDQELLTEYLAFFSTRQLDRLAELAAATDKPSKKDAQTAADTDHGIEIALFGRMVANAPDINVDAACQVAHAISTHAATVEHDYYTAVDDFAPDDNTGAGMLGTIEYTSATLYRYATIAMDRLTENLGTSESAVAAARAFIDAFVRSMPTGKQNTFGNRTPVDAVVVQVRRGQPINLVGAFEDAIVADSGYVEPSARALAEYAEQVWAAYDRPLASFVVRVSPKASALDGLGEPTTLQELGAGVANAVHVESGSAGDA